MEITTKSLFKLGIYFDINGNLYLNYNKKVYQVDINKYDHLEADIGNYKIYNDTPNISYGMLTINTLSDEKELQFDKEIYNYNDYNDMIVPTVNYNHDPIGFFGTENTDTPETKIYFLRTGDHVSIPIIECDNGDMMALYETLVYNDNILCFKTELDGEPPIYRIHLHSNGVVFLEINQGELKKYNLDSNLDSNLVFITK